MSSGAVALASVCAYPEVSDVIVYTVDFYCNFSPDFLLLGDAKE